MMSQELLKLTTLSSSRDVRKPPQAVCRSYRSMVPRNLFDALWSSSSRDVVWCQPGDIDVIVPARQSPCLSFQSDKSILVSALIGEIHG